MKQLTRRELRGLISEAVQHLHESPKKTLDEMESFVIGDWMTEEWRGTPPDELFLQLINQLDVDTLLQRKLFKKWNLILKAASSPGTDEGIYKKWISFANDVEPLLKKEKSQYQHQQSHHEIRTLTPEELDALVSSMVQGISFQRFPQWEKTFDDLRKKLSSRKKLIDVSLPVGDPDWEPEISGAISSEVADPDEPDAAVGNDYGVHPDDLFAQVT